MTRRLLLSYLTITLVVLALLEIPLAVFYQQREEDRITVDAERDATVLATLYEDALEKDEPIDPSAADSYAADTNARVVVVDPDGISVLDTGDEAPRDFSTRPEIIIALTGERSSGTRQSETLGTELLYVAVPVASGGTVHGALRLTLDTEEVNERIRRFWLGLVAVGLVILTVIAGVGWFIARSVTRPVRRLQATADRFSSGDLAPEPVDGGAPVELTALQTTMNEMAGRLDELIERQRSFVADASHQLRTPLTALRLRLENLESTSTDPSASAEIADAIDETTRLSTLVDDLLQLARTENRQELERVDLAEIIRTRVDTWTATADTHQVTITTSLDDGPAFARAVGGGIEQVLDNLLDNAIRATPPNSTITVFLTTADGERRVSVADEGPGMTATDKAAAFTRFWRADNSTPGTGLGLAIADSIVRASGGRLVLGDNSPRGLVATIHLDADSAVVPAVGGLGPWPRSGGTV